MKKIMWLVIMLLALAGNASAWWQLVDCSYGWNKSLRASGYTGIYKNSQGEYFTMWFGPDYCSHNIN